MIVDDVGDLSLSPSEGPGFRDSPRAARVEFVSLLGKSLKAAQIHEHFHNFFRKLIKSQARRMTEWGFALGVKNRSIAFVNETAVTLLFASLRSAARIADSLARLASSPSVIYGCCPHPDPLPG
jgi:hypothetical protein